jgi:NADPH:quinone reductase-like Zn-dependent oxidoreductase
MEMPGPRDRCAGIDTARLKRASGRARYDPDVPDVMKAAIVTGYGSPSVLEVRQVPKPIPEPGDLLIRVHATTVSRTDSGELRAHPILVRLVYGLRRPRRQIFGMDFAGTVESVGDRVTLYKRGDRVFGMCPHRRNGGQAEYVLIAEDGPVALMPDNRDFEEVVVGEGAFYANSGMEKFKIGAGHRMLIYGASGAIGTAAVQLAKARGAYVVAVVGPPHLELARSLGADQVIDYTAGDFTRSEERFDFILDAVGKISYFRCRRLLKPDGAFMSTDAGPWLQNLPLVLGSLMTKSRRVSVPLPARGSAPRFVASLRDLMQEGRFRAVIDRRYPLDAIADAYRYVETGKKTGIVVIQVATG